MQCIGSCGTGLAGFERATASKDDVTTATSKKERMFFLGCANCGDEKGGSGHKIQTMSANSGKKRYGVTINRTKEQPKLRISSPCLDTTIL
mmetsp:Transcript_41892/g.67380  ORF Transcript_41892/g.67380 Transcript_41892/m.67380 type:complete len:91 (+) Transcript_41892:2211-2483(+)